MKVYSVLHESEILAHSSILYILELLLVYLVIVASILLPLCFRPCFSLFLEASSPFSVRQAGVNLLALGGVESLSIGRCVVSLQSAY